MGHERQPQEGLPPIGCLSSAETVVATRKKNWRLDGHKLDRQRDWLGVSKTHPISSPRLVLPVVQRALRTDSGSSRLRALSPTQHADVPRKALTFVMQPPDLFHLDLVQRGPAAKEDRKALVTSISRAPKPRSVKHGHILGKLLDHVESRNSAPPSFAQASSGSDSVISFASSRES